MLDIVAAGSFRNGAIGFGGGRWRRFPPQLRYYVKTLKSVTLEFPRKTAPRSESHMTMFDGVRVWLPFG